jgi:hypothetical protein
MPHFLWCGSVPLPVEPWLKTSNGNGPCPAGISITTSILTGLPPSCSVVWRNAPAASRGAAISVSVGIATLSTGRSAAGAGTDSSKGTLESTLSLRRRKLKTECTAFQCGRSMPYIWRRSNFCVPVARRWNWRALTNGCLSLRMPSLFPCMSGDACLDLRRRDHGADPLLLTW